MSRPRCLITGCELVATNTGATAHGDLHRLGASYVFNAVRDEFGETSWSYGEPPHSDRILFVDTTDVFERRGVIVLAIEDARLSDAARNYVKNWEVLP